MKAVETGEASHRKIDVCTPDGESLIAQRLRMCIAPVGGNLVAVRALIWVDCSVLQRADGGSIEVRSDAACASHY
jgi:hypothetical protein